MVTPRPSSARLEGALPQGRTSNPGKDAVGDAKGAQWTWESAKVRRKVFIPDILLSILSTSGRGEHSRTHTS
jgi:hypothetical protein